MDVQLEFNFDNMSSEGMTLHLMQKQIDHMCGSMGKVRKKLFAELGEVKKLAVVLQRERDELKSVLEALKYDKPEWPDGPSCSLFDAAKHQEIAG